MLTVIIHAGGKSERIREIFPEVLSKCWLELRNIPIILSNILELQNFATEIIIIVKDRSILKSFTKQFHRYDQFKTIENIVKIVVDNETRFPNDHGPMISMKTGINLASNDTILSIPSDIPFFHNKLIQLMDLHLQKSTIVTIQSKDYYNFLIFMAKKQELMNLIEMRWKRATDIYRLFPNVVFVRLDDKYSDFFIGINSKNDYNLAKNLSERLNTMPFPSEKPPALELKRSIDISNEKLFEFPENYLGTLIEEKCYYLLYNLVISKNIQYSLDLKNNFYRK